MQWSAYSVGDSDVDSTIEISSGSFVLEDNVMLTVRPNGTISVSSAGAVFMHDAAVLENTMCGGDFSDGILTTDEG